jgi:beta-glucanase (GH16 family)
MVSLTRTVPSALLAILAPLLVSGCRLGDPRAVTPSADWVLVWEDTFDGAAGSRPSSAWSADTGGDGWGNAQLEYDTDRVENAALDGQGHLAITAREEPYQGRRYTSARLKTQGQVELTYGRVEARLKLPAGRGLWPAFWMLGANLGTAGWPGCGELDIMEARGQEPAVSHGSLHGPGYSGGAAVTKAFTLASGTFTGDFHTFAVEWDQASLTFFVDDTAYQTVTKEGLSGGPWVFDHPFFLILNVAVGGNYVGPPDTSTSFPQSMLVDWVRVLERAH